MSAKATAIFEADDKQLSNALLNINRKLLAFQHTIAKLAVGWEVLKKGGEIAASGFEHFSAALETGAKLVNLSLNTGIAVKDLQVLERQFQLAGKSAEDVGPVMAKMLNSIATGSAAEMVRRLGINMQELRKKTPAEQFRQIGEAINRLPDTAERVAAAKAIFGRGGADLLAMFSSGEFGAAAEQVGQQAEILNKDAALFKDVSDKLGLSGLKVQGFFVGVADRVAPVLKPLLDRFATLDLSGLGQQVGNFIALFAQAFQDGKLGEVILDSLELSFANAANFLLGLLTAIGKALGELAMQGFKNALLVLQIATTADFWAGLGKALLAAGESFIALMLNGIAQMLETIAKVPGLGKVAGAADSVRSTAADLNRRAEGNMEAAADNLTPAFDAIKARLGEELKSVASSAMEGFDQGSSVIDTSGMSARLDKVVGEVMDHAQKATDEALKEVPTKTPDAPTGEALLTKDKFSHLQKIGGGGYSGGGDPLLTENRQQTRELRELNRGIKQLIEKKTFQPGVGFVPVFS